MFLSLVEDVFSLFVVMVGEGRDFLEVEDGIYCFVLIRLR